jgi:ubiquinone/menaquinone biosynthesis C-methylase UbiE
MDEAEFDRFADEYRSLHESNIRISGEKPEYFAEYKIADVASLLAERTGEELAILDFGAGVGTSVPYFRKYFPECDLTCLDVSRKSLNIGRARFPEDARFVHFDGVVLPFPTASFDLVFLACVLHHIDQAQHFGLLGELFRVLRPSGRIIVFEHNPLNPLTAHAFNTCEFDENAQMIRSGYLRSVLSSLGFVRPRTRYRIFFPRVLRLLRFLEPWMTWLPLGAQYSIHARKAS